MEDREREIALLKARIAQFQAGQGIPVNQKQPTNPAPRDGAGSVAPMSAGVGLGTFTVPRAQLEGRPSSGILFGGNPFKPCGAWRRQPN